MIFYFKTKEWVEEVDLILIFFRMMLQSKWEVNKKMNLSMLFCNAKMNKQSFAGGSTKDYHILSRTLESVQE
jgi:hypothetical protein